MVGTTSDWKDELGCWLKPFLARLGHKGGGRCVRFCDGPGLRRGIMINCPVFVFAGVWDAAPLETELLVQADKLVGGSDAVLVIDDTAIAKNTLVLPRPRRPDTELEAKEV